MKLIEAQAVLANAIELRSRWGNKLSDSDFNPGEVLDALVVLDEYNEDTLSKDVLKVKQQLGASTSREKKLKKQKEELQTEVQRLKDSTDALKRHILSLEGQIQGLRDELEAEKLSI